MGKDYGARIRLSLEEERLVKDFRNGKVKKSEKKDWVEKEFKNEVGEVVMVDDVEEWVLKSRIWRRLPTFKNVLVVGDLHAPFIRKGYLEHCMRVRDKYRCNHTIFIGDIVDNHYSSFHATDPGGMGGDDELDYAIERLDAWHQEFPDADVILGNHDKIVLRKIFKEGVSKRWIRRFSDVLEVPSWQFVEGIEYDNVKYTHGLKGGAVNGAMTKAKNRGKSLVQGHWHSRSYVRWHVTDNDRIFAMQVGCGVDEDAYAMAYNEDPMERWILSCGVVLENGTLPIVEPMKL
jgi:hypothetical protein